MFVFELYYESFSIYSPLGPLSCICKSTQNPSNEWWIKSKVAMRIAQKGDILNKDMVFQLKYVNDWFWKT